MTNSTAGETVGSVADLLNLILVRLPLKSLIRFKLVSKQWHSLIKPIYSPAPVGLFYSFSKNKTKTVSVNYIPFSSSSSSSRIMSSDYRNGIIIRQSCNGLLLGTKDKIVSSESLWFVWNPTTRRVTTIPECPVRGYDVGEEYKRTLCFDPAKSPYYKIVHIMVMHCNSEQLRYHIHIYSSETRLWSSSKFYEQVIEVCGRHRVKPFHDDGLLQFYETGVYSNGAVHWIGGAKSLYLNIFEEDDGVVINKMNKFPSPPNASACDLYMQCHFLGECCGRVHYITKWSARISIYELKRDRSEWFLMYRAEVPSLYIDGIITRELDDFVYGVSVVHGAEKDDSFLVLRTAQRFLRLNLVSNTVQVLGWSEERMWTDEVTNICHYIAPICVVADYN